MCFYIDPSAVWRQASTSRERSLFLCNLPYKTKKRHQANNIHKTNKKIYPAIQKVYCAVNLDDMNIKLDNLWLFFFFFFLQFFWLKSDFEKCTFFFFNLS